MSDSVRPHRRQPTRLRHPWESPGKNTGMGCHFLLQCMKMKSESKVNQSCPTLRDRMDCSPPGSSAQATVLSGLPLPSPVVGYPLQYSWASLVAQLVKNPPAMWETWIQSLGWEDPLEKGKATYSCYLTWRIPWTIMGSQKSWIWLNNFHFTFILQFKPFLYTCNLLIFFCFQCNICIFPL